MNIGTEYYRCPVYLIGIDKAEWFFSLVLLLMLGVYARWFRSLPFTSVVNVWVVSQFLGPVRSDLSFLRKCLPEPV